MDKIEIEKYVQEYNKRRHLYKILTEKVANLIEEVLKLKGINYVNVESRTKSLESFRNKISKKIDFSPREMQDLSGIRIIAHTNIEVEKIGRIIKELVKIDERRSIDKSKSLGIDKVGYKSQHFVATLPEKRTILQEFLPLKGLCFEIQIRTILQHAWAEMQHDRNYKFSGILPEEIKRRLSLLAGQLEIADNEFDRISQEIEQYSKEVAQKTEEGDLDIPIDSTSLREYLSNKFKRIKIENIFGPNDDQASTIIEELKLMKINKLEDLDRIIPSDLEEKILQNPKKYNNYLGLLRDILMIYNAKEYFEKAWRRKWDGIGGEVINLISSYVPNFWSIASEYITFEEELTRF